MGEASMAILIMTVTAYTNCDPGMPCDGIMASGLGTFDGACACGPAWPFGTAFWIPELRRGYICQDRGNEIGNRNLDIWMEERDTALEFGVRALKVIVMPNVGIINQGGKDYERANKASDLIGDSERKTHRMVR